jgi:hypothetical protein
MSVFTSPCNCLGYDIRLKREKYFRDGTNAICFVGKSLRKYDKYKHFVFRGDKIIQYHFEIIHLRVLTIFILKMIMNIDLVIQDIRI